MNVSSFITKDNNLQGTKSLRCQETESDSNSTKIICTEETHIIRAKLGWRTDEVILINGYAYVFEKKRDQVFSYLWLQNIILMLWDYHNQILQRLYLE